MDYWQPARIADAYAVAAELGSTFKVSRYVSAVGASYTYADP
jgi:hypothetical protein